MKQDTQANKRRLSSLTRATFCKQLLLLLIATSSFSSLPAQLQNGTWAGTMHLANDYSSYNIRLSFYQLKLTAFTSEVTSASWMLKAGIQVKQDDQTILVTCMESCEFGTRSELYKIRFTGTDTAYVSWWRSSQLVNSNYKKTDVWEMNGTGMLLKQKHQSSLASAY